MLNTTNNSDNNQLMVDLMAFINNELSQDKMLIINDWINKNQENKAQFDSIKKAWELSGKLNPKPVSVNTDNAWDKVLNQIENKKDTKIISFNFKPLIAIAASIAIIFSVVIFNRNTKVEQAHLFSNNEIIQEVLSDGSEITLNKSTLISYNTDFNKKERRVSLEGEAFFDIERNEEKAFIIDLPNNDSYVKVLGTSFSIKAEKDDSIHVVIVKSGRVEFGNGENKIILTKGEKGFLNTNTGEFTKEVSNGKNSTPFYWIDQTLNFDNVKLIDVVSNLNQIFNDTVVLNCDKFRNKKIVSQHKGESLSEIIEVISEIHGLKITKFKLKNKIQYSLDCNEE